MEEISLPAIGNDNKVINQLDEVTRDSEQKASEIFEMLESVSENSQQILSCVEDLNKYAQEHQINDSSFHELLNKIAEYSNSSEDNILNIMDKMQYQDIHRQKIERVINIMRALSNYMNSLFSSEISDEERVSSAKYIKGDEADDVLSDEEIENMINQFS